MYLPLICITGVWTQTVLVFIQITKFLQTKCYEKVSDFNNKRKRKIAFNLAKYIPIYGKRMFDVYWKREKKKKKNQHEKLLRSFVSGKDLRQRTRLVVTKAFPLWSNRKLLSVF